MQSSHDLLETSVANPTATKAVRLELPTVPLDALKASTKRSKTIKTTEERPTWLPDGWIMDVRRRTSSKREGYTDRYYYNPNIHHRFRSRKEVESFLKTETTRENKPKPKQVESHNDRNENSPKFNSKNCPTKVSWVLSNYGQGLWTPYVNSEEVPKSTKSLWVAKMEDIINDVNNS
ncbi:hypothetical protein MRB53_014445 [Persea americana]|uniref:Uncharacterized protein n=1 Tax=Persea americana TaxID=3435 RepID=A0ACC2KAV8_PERAE|nr:hypothetical protein MRB53_014445 [Persea americana]|eukprot:TRINITY_DN380_c1_g1_i1.p1 TRINITY_DN380_c1_g1~~TRINITY_DN380_c1_g1_i1.p1  ORF type:complete len:177 (+),score=22.85 TRINITY_DN380_c1_g1_i1:139-669(+)